MRRVVLAALLALSLPASSRAADAATPEALAKAVLAGLQAGDAAGVTARFDAAMKAAMPAEQVAQLWPSLVAQVGPLQSAGEPKVTEAGGYALAFIPLTFEKARLLMRVAVDGQGQVAGLFIVPAEPEAAPPPEPVPPDAPFTESEVTLGEGGGALPGSLTMPKGNGPFPAVVLVHGSGPNDRDESVGALRPFRDIAHGLASRGIAVLRYEKRTRRHPQAIALVANQLTTQVETENDAVLAVQLLARTQGVDAKRIVLAGHSLGGTLAPRIAEHTPLLAGLVVLEGSARPLPDVVVDQIAYLGALDGTTTPEEQAALDDARARAEVYHSPAFDASTPATALPLNLPAAYWLDLKGYDPVATASRLPQPILVVQGGRDYQVTMKDLERWRAGLAGRDGVTFKVYPRLNHLLVEGRGRPDPAEYQKEGHVHADVLDDIAAWIAALPR